MNTRIIKIAYLAAVGLILMGLLVVMAVGRQEPSSGQQNSNQSSNKNTNNNNSGAASNANSEANATTNAAGSANVSAGGQAGASAAVSNADRKFATTAAMDGMAEVELGRLAAERGASDAVKQFGQRMVDDHSKANDQLKQWAATAGVTLPTALDAKHQAVVAKLTGLSGAAFDKAYAKQMVKDHTKAVQLFQREADRGADAGLKTFASTTLPTLQEHLQMARSLNTGGGGHNMGGNTSSGGTAAPGGNNNANRR